MTARKASVVVLVGFSASLAAPLSSEAQEAVFVEWAFQALKSPAAKFFYITAGTYLFNRTADAFVSEYNKPDPNDWERRYKRVKEKFPEYNIETDILKDIVLQNINNDEFEKRLKRLNALRSVAKNIDQNATKPRLSVELPPSQLLPSLRPQPTPFNLDLDEMRPQPTPFNLDLDEMLLQPRRWDVREKIRGTWAFVFSSPDGSDHTAFCFIFGADGNFASHWTAGKDRIDSATGTYTTVGRTVTIQWANGGVETAAIDQVDDNHLRYELTRHSSNSRLVGLKSFLTRISDPVTTSIIAVSNPTLEPIKFSTRWALMDGIWTEWKEWTIEPFETLRVTGRGGFHCQVQFDSSFAEGYQEKHYCLPFDIATAPSDPLPKSGGMPYRFEIDGDWIELKQDNSITPADVGVQ